MITKHLFTNEIETFLTGETILINKPINWTSFDVVNKIRYLLRHKLNIKNIKVGHAGTLDPLATGLMIINTGKATKKINEIQKLDKEYISTFTFGGITPSFDRETNVTETFPTEHITKELIEKTIQDYFLGDIVQIPPAFSAKKIDGKPSYAYARKGIEKILSPKQVCINSFKIIKNEFPNISFSVNCTSGTYIRSLARDLGEKLSSGAYVNKLERTKIGTFFLVDSLNITTFANLLKKM